MRNTYRHGTALATGKQGAWEPLAANVVASKGAKLSCRGPQQTKKLMTYVEYKKTARHTYLTLLSIETI